MRHVDFHFYHPFHRNGKDLNRLQFLPFAERDPWAGNCYAIVNVAFTCATVGFDPVARIMAVMTKNFVTRFTHPC